MQVQTLQGPALLSANFNNSTSVVLLFDEQLDPTSANDANNYTIPGLTISSASFTAPNQVLLTVSPMVDQTYLQYNDCWPKRL